MPSQVPQPTQETQLTFMAVGEPDYSLHCEAVRASGGEEATREDWQLPTELRPMNILYEIVKLSKL